jgi:alpha-1,6-mannosyltransferase
VGWNPLLLFETAVNAHNDIVMMAFALAAFYALVRRWWLAIFPLLVLAALVKFVTLLFVPLVLIWLLLRRDVPKWQVALSLVLGSAIGAAACAPFFAGGALFDTLRGEGSRYLLSTGSMTVSLLMQRGVMNLPEAEVAMRRGLVAAFAVGLALLLGRFRRDPSYSFLTTTCAAAVFLLLVTVKWWFWPWYLAWLVPVAALAPRRGMALLASTFSLTAMLLYAAYYWHVYGDWHTTQQLVFKTVFAVPLGLSAALVMYWLLRKAWEHLRPRAAPTGARSAGIAPSVER